MHLLHTHCSCWAACGTKSHTFNWEKCSQMKSRHFKRWIVILVCEQTVAHSEKSKGISQRNVRTFTTAHFRSFLWSLFCTSLKWMPASSAPSTILIRLSCCLQAVSHHNTRRQAAMMFPSPLVSAPLGDTLSLSPFEDGACRGALSHICHDLICPGRSLLCERFNNSTIWHEIFPNANTYLEHI